MLMLVFCSIADERLRTKALSVKVRCLEEERDELRRRLRHYEQQQPQPNEQQRGGRQSAFTAITQPTSPSPSQAAAAAMMLEANTLAAVALEAPTSGASRDDSVELRQHEAAMAEREGAFVPSPPLSFWRNIIYGEFVQ